ncbi:MAG: hypothetical protein ACI4US_07565, partial [Muribaculaceae bacterium]
TNFSNKSLILQLPVEPAPPLFKTFFQKNTAKHLHGSKNVITFATLLKKSAIWYSKNSGFSSVG